MPLLLDDGAWKTHPDIPWAWVAARLKRGVTPAQGEAEANVIAVEVSARLLPNGHHWGMLVIPMQNLLVENSRSTLIMLLAAVAVVLLIACTNVANLLLARASSRQKEMAVRTALGASSGRIVRQVLTESVLLSLIGGIFGICLAGFGVDLLSRAVGGVLPSMMQPAIDLPVLAFTLVVACGAGVLFGLFPALRARRTDVNRDLREAGRSSTSGARTRAQSLLIISEVALTVMLLIGAGLLLRSFARVLAADPGFNPRNALVCDVTITRASFQSDSQAAQFGRDLVQQIEALPGVEAAGTSTTPPFSGELLIERIGLSEQPLAEHLRGSGVDYVGGNYFRAMGISLLKGRLFSASEDVANANRVAVINEEVATFLMPGENPLGRHIHVGSADWEVIGVVENVRQSKMDVAAPRSLYLPHVYNPHTVRLIVRTRVAPMSLADDVRRTIAAIDPNQSISNVRTLEQAIGRSLQERRVALVLLGLFAAIALGLACIGIYGVMAYTIGQRERELSIRMALGAERSDVIRLVLRDGLRLGAIGTVAGLLGGLAGSQLIASRLYEVSARDPVVFVLAATVITLVTLLAVYLPARRASHLDARLALLAE